MKFIWRLIVYAANSHKVWLEAEDQQEIYRAMCSSKLAEELFEMGYREWQMTLEQA